MHLIGKAASFLVITFVAYQLLGSNRQISEDSVPDFFPVVLIIPDSNPAAFRLVRWREIESMSSDGQVSFGLPSGEFSLQLPEGDHVHRVRLKVANRLDRQSVEVDWRDDDYTIEAVYDVVANSVQPVSLRMWHAMTLLPALIIGHVGTKILLFMFSRLRRRSTRDVRR